MSPRLNEIGVHHLRCLINRPILLLRSLTLLLLLFLHRLRRGTAHLLLLDDVALLQLLEAQLHHFLLEVSVLEDIFFTVVGVSHQVRSQLVRGVDLHSINKNLT